MMKKIFKLTMLLLVLTWSTNLFATDYMVSGAGSSDVNGTYIESGTFNGKPYYQKGEYYILYEGCTAKWKITNSLRPYTCPYYRTSVDGDTPPTLGWTVGDEGTNPVPTVNPAGKIVSYSSTTLFESDENDGSIKNTLTLTHNNFDGETFTGNVNDDYIAAGKATVSNVPVGLTANLTLSSATTVEFTLTGSATAHTNANDIVNLTIVFANAAFSGGDASGVLNSSKSDLEVNFLQIHTVAASGADYTTIAAAIVAAEDYDVINIAAGTYTEAGLAVNKILTFKGEAANTTIVQAAASYNTASDRVFYITSENACFYDLTIRYGKGHSGSGIYSKNNLEIYRCHITDNISQSSGGGIFSSDSDDNYLIIEDCLISNNISTGYVGGGLSACGEHKTIKNTTFVSNTSSGHVGGGGIYLDNADADIINCTLTGNTANNASSGGGGIYAYNCTVNIKNSIIFDNTCATAGADVYRSSNLINAYNSIIGEAAGFLASAINGTSENISSSAPMLSALTDNGGPTQTCALQLGSPAINAGTTGDDIPTTDQRGLYANGIRDIGAYEFDGAASLAVPMQLTFVTTAADQSIELPLYGTVDCTVDWGDESATEDFTTSGNKAHTFAIAGTYTVSISGDLTQFGTYSAWTGVEYLTEVVSFGDVGLTSLYGAFTNADNLTSVPATLPSSVTDLTVTFSEIDQASITNLDLWDVSNVTNMSATFSRASAFNQNIGSWNTANVTNMGGIFSRASAFNQDINTKTINAEQADEYTAWDVSNVVSMSQMFYKASAFNRAIGNWDVSNVVNMSSMFADAVAFNQDIGSWDVSSVTNMHNMLYVTSVFNQDIGNWNVSNVTDMSGMFWGASVFNQDISTKTINAGGLDVYEAWDVVNVTNMDKTFTSAAAFNQNIGNWNVGKVTNMNSMFNSASVFNQDIHTWNVSNVTNMESMFMCAYAFNQDIGTWTVSNVTNMRAMFIYTDVFNQDISSWDVSNVTNMKYMFYEAMAFDQNLSAWQIGAVTDMTDMFKDAVLSTENYDALLTSWAAQTVQSNVTFGAGNTQYSAGEAATAHASLKADDLWTITDGGQLKTTPTITWEDPESLVYGATLSATELDATTSVEGSFAYSPALASILSAGEQELTVIFTPTDAESYEIAYDTVSIMVNKAELNATAKNASKKYNTENPEFEIDYNGFVNDETLSVLSSEASATTEATIASNVGTYDIIVSGAAADNYNITYVKGTLTVEKATPTITWATPSAITYGTALSSSQLNASSSVDGAFAYSPDLASIPSAGEQELTVIFTPTDAESYEIAYDTVSIMVNKATPVITWEDPESLVYGASLSATELDATCNVEGTLTYNPPMGMSMLTGSHTLNVEFVPTDASNYTEASTSVHLEVVNAELVATVSDTSRTYNTENPEFKIEYAGFVNGDDVSSLDRQATITTDATIDSQVGTYDIIASNGLAEYYNITYVKGTLTVEKATPTITWATPSAITYGTALNSSQLNATTTVEGAFAYSPASASILSAGEQELTVIFTPTDAESYEIAYDTVSIMVNKATPVITWEDPESLVYGATLSATELDATCNVEGTLTYTPPMGMGMLTGSHTLNVEFVPTDASNYTEASTSVHLEVVNAELVATVSDTSRTYNTENPEFKIEYAGFVNGDDVSSLDRQATITTDATIDSQVGTYDIIASNGLAEYYNITYVKGTLTVEKATPVITWTNPSDINLSTALSATQLNATAEMSGTFVYTPAAGVVLERGLNQELTVIFTPDNTDDYAVAYDTVYINVDQATAMTNAADATFQVYPNPVSDGFYVALKGSESSQVMVTLMDASGRVLLRQAKASGSYISAQDFTPGMYVLHLQVEGQSAIKKLIIK